MTTTHAALHGERVENQGKHVEKIWLSAYAEAVPAELPTPEYKSIRELFEASFEKYPEKPCYTCMGTTLSYRDIDQMSMQFACYLQNELGLVKGERVAVLITSMRHIDNNWHLDICAHHGFAKGCGARGGDKGEPGFAKKAHR